MHPLRPLAPLALLFLLPIDTPSAQAGTVKGQVIYPTAPPTEATVTPPPLAYWRVDNGVIPPMPAPEPREAVIVMLEPVAPPSGAPSPVTVSIKARGLEPHVVVAQIGASIVFKNEDKVAHTLYSKHSEALMPREATPPGASREVKSFSPGEYPIADADFPHGGAHLIVVQSPYVVRPDDKGGFTLEVPDGRYVLKAWLHGTWNEGQPVEVAGKAVKDVVVKLAPPRAPGAADKK